MYGDALCFTLLNTLWETIPRSGYTYLSSHRSQVDTQQMRLQSLFINCETK
jgi:hypothetical protein